MNKLETRLRIAPEVLASRPLSAREVAAAYGIDIVKVLDACNLFVQSRGRKGLRCYREGRYWKIRPVNVEAWIEGMEEETARCLR